MALSLKSPKPSRPEQTPVVGTSSCADDDLAEAATQVAETDALQPKSSVRPSVPRPSAFSRAARRSPMPSRPPLFLPSPSTCPLFP